MIKKRFGIIFCKFFSREEFRGCKFVSIKMPELNLVTFVLFSFPLIAEFIISFIVIVIVFIFKHKIQNNNV